MSESACFCGHGFPVPVLSLIPNFQHKHLPHLFDRTASWKPARGFGQADCTFVQPKRWFPLHQQTWRVVLLGQLMLALSHVQKMTYQTAPGTKIGSLRPICMGSSMTPDEEFSCHDVFKMMNVAIAVFCFNRPHSLNRLLNSLETCSEAKSIPLFIYVDAARNSNETVAVADTISVADSFEHPLKTVIRRDENLGLKKSLTLGISEVLNLHDSVIVLEDDLVIGPFALNYFLRGLKEYRDLSQVVSICGYAVGESNGFNSETAHFLPLTHPWGWATWRDRWLPHMAGTVSQASMDSTSFRVSMNVFGLRSYSAMLLLADRGLVSSWWIYWQLNAVNRHSVSLFPKKSHVSNEGLKKGTHSSRMNLFVNALPLKEISQSPTNLPTEVMIDFNALDRIVRSREARIFRLTGFLGHIKRLAKEILSRYGVKLFKLF